MKKLALTALCVMALSAVYAQEKGKFEVHDLNGFKIHVYTTNDALGDASFIIEGKSGLVTLESPIFKDNVAEFNTYAEKLGKPIEKNISDYHMGEEKKDGVVMPEGMPEFVKGPAYSGMMQGFAKNFGDAIVTPHAGTTNEVAFGSTQNWAGVSFKFSHGASTGFPAASILIGGKAYYTHWAYAKAHGNNLHYGSAAAIDAELAEAQNALNSGATLFIGGHGGAGDKEAVQFVINYLNTIKKLMAENKTADAFAKALKTAYPNLPGEEGVEAMANALYK